MVAVVETVKNMPRDVDEIIINLRRNADTATWHIGYLKAIIDQEVFKNKTRDSYSGYAIEAATVAVKQSLIMYCTRTWDKPSKKNPLISIRSAMEYFYDPEKLIKECKIQHEYDCFERLESRFARHHKKIIAQFNLLEGDVSHGPLRVLRSENYAHLVVRSFDRDRLEKKGQNHNTTWNELIRVSEETVKLVGEIGYLWDGLSNPYPERIDKALSYSNEFWRIMPILGDKEDPNLF